MSQIEVERFLGRLITDAAFKNKAVDSLEICCFEEGFTLSDDELALLQRLDISRITTLSELLDDALKRS